MLTAATRIRSPLRTRWYNAHGISIVAVSGDDELLAAVDALLQPFISPAPASSTMEYETTRAAISIQIEPMPAPRLLPREARAWLELPPIRLSVDGDAMYLELDGTLVATLCGGSRIIAWLPVERITERWTIAHYVLQPLLMEALRSHDLVMVHAAALADDARVALFPAASGCGKTTLTLAMLRAGFRFLSDDSPFLRLRDGRIEVCGFPERVNVMERTSRFFPELRSYWLAGERDPHREKVPLDVTAVYGACMGETGTPGAIIFPEIVEDETSSVAPLSKTEALFRLLPLAGCSPSPTFAQTQFDLLSRLVRDVPCLTLRTGRDFDALPGVVRQILSDMTRAD